MSVRNAYAVSMLVVGMLLGAVAHALVAPDSDIVHAQPARQPVDVATLAADAEAIKGKLPDQSHAMQDVSYHFSNLWFAGQKENWPLAAFYHQETLSHLRWAVRIIPKRKDSTGAEIDLEAILQAFENSPWTELKTAIAAQDKSAFEKAYRFSLETCYACHKACDKPFIHPQIPTRPESPIINFDPHATWP